jgi:hypothetical protein
MKRFESVIDFRRNCEALGRAVARRREQMTVESGVLERMGACPACFSMRHCDHAESVPDNSPAFLSPDDTWSKATDDADFLSKCERIAKEADIEFFIETDPEGDVMRLLPLGDRIIIRDLNTQPRSYFARKPGEKARPRRR